MREIKFRAWNKRDKRMEYNVNVNQGKPVKQGYQWLNTENIETVYGSPLQQFTGLKDSNGNEIYEGDIYQYLVQFSHYDHYKGAYKSTSVVEWREGAFWVGEYLLSEALYGDFQPEIIGNIYENPELIK